MVVSHTTRVITQDKILEPVHVWGERAANGDIDLRPPPCYISKIQVNGNLAYSATPTTTIYIYYGDDDVGEIVLFGPLYISTVEETIGVTLHMKTLLGQDLKIRPGKNGRLIARMTNTNTLVRMDAWGWKYVEQ